MESRGPWGLQSSRRKWGCRGHSSCMAPGMPPETCTESGAPCGTEDSGRRPLQARGGGKSSQHDKGMGPKSSSRSTHKKNTLKNGTDNQNYTEIPFAPPPLGQVVTRVGEDVETPKLSHIVAGSVQWCSHSGNSWGSPQSVKCS